MVHPPVQVVKPDELQEADPTPGGVRKLAFQTDNNIVVQAHVDGGMKTGWHHHGDRHVYAYLVNGEATIEYGPAGSERVDLETGDFGHIEPGTVHRDINPGDDAQLWVLNFVGTGPLVENVDGPEP